jgi:hypothetical protein
VGRNADLYGVSPKGLPKPDGEARAVYTGFIHPSSITDFALAAPLYFGELIVAHPFVHPGIMKKEMSPTGNPKSYRQEFLKTILFFLNIMPLVDLGLVNLIPDPLRLRLPSSPADDEHGAGSSSAVRPEG